MFAERGVLMKKVIIRFIIIFVAVLFLYLSYGFYLSLKIDNIISNSLKGISYNSNLSSCISEENYDYMNPIQSELEEGHNNLSKDIQHSFPMVFPFINSVSYNYTYTVTDADNGEVLYASSDAQMRLTVTYGIFSIFIQDINEVYYPY